MEIQIKSREERGIKDLNAYELTKLKIQLHSTTSISYNRGSTVMIFKFVVLGEKEVIVKNITDYGVTLHEVLKDISDIEARYVDNEEFDGDVFGENYTPKDII